jgi:hypothetical protein
MTQMKDSCKMKTQSGLSKQRNSLNNRDAILKIYIVGNSMGSNNFVSLMTTALQVTNVTKGCE